MIKPLSELSREEEGRALRALLGMVAKRRTVSDLLEISEESVALFLHNYTVGVTYDGIAGSYTLLIQRKEEHERLLPLP